MNIFDNCIKYSKENTEVTVKQWIQTNTNDAIISIRNIPKYKPSTEDMENLFNLGFRGSNARQMIASGTGLGLAICQLLIENKHRGSIIVQNDKDGLLFYIKVPDAWREK